MRPHSERYDGVGEVAGFADDLEERWESERERRRVYVGHEEAAFEVEVLLPGSPALVWEYLTAPDKRMLWQADHVAEVPPGGRRGAGTTSFCVDGRARIYEEISTGDRSATSPNAGPCAGRWASSSLPSWSRSMEGSGS